MSEGGSRCCSGWISGTGAAVRNGIQDVGEFTRFVVASILGYLAKRHRLRKLLNAVDEIGVRCTPLILCVGFFTGMVLGLQGYYTLTRFGSEGLLGPAVALSLIRELGPVLTALMIVGQAGSTLSAELGHQRHAEQIDALSTMRISPGAFLVGPRLVAAIICFPILTAFFDLIGIMGGFVTGVILLHVDSGTYWNELYEGVEMLDVNGGFVKSLAFAVITIGICTFYGFFTHRRTKLPGAQGISRTTTQAVVVSCVAVLITDYLITSFYV